MKSKIVLYKGKRGSGKTLTMVKDGFKYYLSGYVVLRNFECEFGRYINEEEILNIDKNSSLNNCVIMIDELQIFFDSRRSMAKQNIKFSNFLQQVRKRGIVILATTQYSNTIDLRFRQHVDIIAIPKYYDDLRVCEVKYIDVTSSEEFGSIGNVNLNMNVIVYNAEPIFKLYNTEEMIK